MKIAILVPSFSKYSGDARVAELQAKELTEDGNEVAIFALGGDIQPPSHVKLYIMGMPQNSVLERIYRLIFPLDFMKIKRWLPELRNYDMVISHLYPMHWLAYLLKRRYNIRYVYYDHGIDKPEFFPKIHEKIYLKLFTFLNKLSTKNVDKAISVSKFASQELKKLFGLESEVRYNKVNTKIFRRGLDGSVVRDRHGIGEAPLILFVGRVTPQKGVHLLIKAFKLIKRKIPGAKLMIVGKHTYDYYSRELKQMSDDSVIFVESVSHEELANYYAACDVYATCSLRESFNLPVAEARACGKPVVAFDIGPHREILNGDGVLVDKGDILEFADACVEIIKRSKPNEVIADESKKKICLVCSHGGHLTELLRLMDAFDGHEYFFITYDVVRTRKLRRKYLLKNIGRDPLKLLTIIPGIIRILQREKPDLIVSTGAEIAIPVFYIGKLLFGIKTVFIESWCRVKEPSHTGRIVYPVSDWFLVQWESLLKRYGAKARYKGAVF
jgi:1,2-diacylglycerol 3-alpha-glucosyltransferase